jgi:undecaprenyl-phosphate galactose phosphotransferase
LPAAVVIMLLSRFFSRYLTQLLMALGISFLAIGFIGLLYTDEAPILTSRWQILLLGFVFSIAIIYLCRYMLIHLLFNRLLRRRYRKRVVIVGSDREAENVTNHIVTMNAPFWVAGFVSSDRQFSMKIPVHKDKLGDINKIPIIVEQESIDDIVVTDENMEKTILISLLDYCIAEGITVWFPLNYMPVINMKLYPDTFCGLSMIRLCSQKHSWTFNKMKYSLDALVSLTSFLFFLPFFGVIGLLIKINSSGPVFYRANAIGKNGQAFSMYKFRSMKVNNDSTIHKDYVTKLIRGENCQERDENQPLKVTEDPRVTKVGRWLRKLSLDELPQIINVLKGEMSLVGPRPCLPYEYEIYKEWHKKRMSIRPGITGLWQVVGRSQVPFEDMVLLDLFYVYNRNILMDMNILFETVFAVLERRGAY